MAPTDPQQHYIEISIPPAPVFEVEYYATISRTILLTNVSSYTLLVENVTLRFRSDKEEAVLDVKTECGWELESGSVHEQTVEITPTPLYSSNTNTFDVKVQSRVTQEGKPSGPKHDVYTKQSYLIIREPTTHIARVFISVKQPEDLDFGRMLEKLARRAGFLPFLKANNPNPGEDIWDSTIEPVLRGSDAAFVIWTEKTVWGKGVEREIGICREAGIPEILLLQSDLEAPDLYDDTPVEYVRFDPHNPGPTFADAVNALRLRIVKRSGG